MLFLPILLQYPEHYPQPFWKLCTMGTTLGSHWRYPTSYLQSGTNLTPVTFNTGRALLPYCTNVNLILVQYSSGPKMLPQPTSHTAALCLAIGGGAANYGGSLTLTASSINCKGILYTGICAYCEFSRVLATDLQPV